MVQKWDYLDKKVDKFLPYPFLSKHKLTLKRSSLRTDLTIVLICPDPNLI